VESDESSLPASPRDLYTRRSAFAAGGLVACGAGILVLATLSGQDWPKAITIMVLTWLTLVCTLMAVLLRRETRRRHAAEEAAREATTKLDMIDAYASDVIVHVGMDGRNLFVSAAYERIFGRQPNAILGEMTGQFIHPDDRPILREAEARVRAGREPGAISCRIIDANGEWRQIESNGRRLPNGGGAVYMLRDVTERMRLEERLRQSQRMEAIGQLTAGVAHDFNNLLQAQIGNLEQLIQIVGNRPESRNLVDQTLAMAERGARMTHQLLSFSRQQSLRPAAVSLGELIPRLASLLRQMLGAGIEVVTALDPATPPVLVDAACLETALLNLALNARDAMPGGGELRLQAVPQDGLVAEMPADLDRSRRYGVLVVTDGGCGMDEATLRRAGEPFFTTRGVNGSGLGLASALGFSRQSGGDLRITSVVGVGTRIEIWLPAAETNVSFVAAPPARPPLPARRGRPARVLLVDDDAGVLAALGVCVRDAGFDVEQACDADMALTILESGARFDALVTDFILPGRDGVALVAEARRICPDIATVLITGWARTDRMRQLPSDTQVLYKPFKSDELALRLQRVLAQNTKA
jgi:PAS domain S-box-containing protein